MLQPKNVLIFFEFKVFEKWRHIPNVLDIDILNIAQSRLQGDAHWLHGKLIMYDETVIALGYAVVVVS